MIPTQSKLFLAKIAVATIFLEDMRKNTDNPRKQKRTSFSWQRITVRKEVMAANNTQRKETQRASPENDLSPTKGRPAMRRCTQPIQTQRRNSIRRNSADTNDTQQAHGRNSNSTHRKSAAVHFKRSPEAIIPLPTAMIAPEDYVHIFKNDLNAAPYTDNGPTPACETPSDKYQPLPTAMIAPGDYQHIFHKPGEGSQAKINTRQKKTEASRRASKRVTNTKRNHECKDNDLVHANNDANDEDY